jgi:DNA-binding MarR family transcriptional regulator
MVPGAPTEEQLALGHAFEQVVTWLRRTRTATDISASGLSLLDRLATAGPQRITELADWESVAQPTMTTLVGRLEAQGLVRRDPDPGDRRAVLVAVTTRGEETVQLRRRARAVALELRLERLDEEERERLRDAIPALVRLAEGEARG